MKILLPAEGFEFRLRQITKEVLLEVVHTQQQRVNVVPSVPFYTGYQYN
jgi:hypothetical protein